MDGALHLWTLLRDVFKDIKNKVFVLDIIHVLEYIWIIAHIKHKEGSDGGKKKVRTGMNTGNFSQHRLKTIHFFLMNII
jgi:hypothetical protein